MDCKLCQTDCTENPAPETIATGVCGECRGKLGIVPMPPSRRRARPCAHCNGLRFVRVLPRELAATGSDYVYSHASPMTATMIPEVKAKLLFRGRNVAQASGKAGAGKLEMYICKGCGLIEWHCIDPESIPIGSEYMTEEVDFEPDTAYRD